MSQRCPACAEFVEAAGATCPFCGEKLGEAFRPPVPAAAGAPSQDESHLGTLSTLHLVFGVLEILVASVFIIHLVLGLVMVLNPGALSGGKGGPPPPAVGLVFVIVGACVVLLGWTLGLCTIQAGRCLKRRQRRAFCMVMAALHCLQMPLGTLLGVFTLLVLSRPSVRDSFDRSP